MEDPYFIEQLTSEQILYFTLHCSESSRKILLDVEPFGDAEHLGYIKSTAAPVIPVLSERPLPLPFMLIDEQGNEWGRVFLTSTYDYIVYASRFGWFVLDREAVAEIASDFPETRLAKRI